MPDVTIALDPAMIAPRPVAEAIQAAAAAGFRHVEVGNRPDFVPAFAAPVAPVPELRRVSALAGDLGIAVASLAVIQAWSSPDEPTRRQAVDWWRIDIAAASELGVTRINTELSGDLDRPEASRESFLRSYESLRPDLRDARITVAVEPHPNDFVETTAAVLDVIEATGDSGLRYLHCIPHAFHLGGRSSDQIARSAGRLDHVHLADAFRPERTILNPASARIRVHQHLDPGQGEIDFGQVATALGRIDFRGLVTVQVFAWPDRAEASFVHCRAAVERFVADIEAARPT